MQDATLGFIGLGVMGGPMCRNLAAKCGRPVVAFDLHQPPPENALAARSVAEVAQRADLVFLSLPGEAEIRQVCNQLDKTKTLVDCSTAPVALARELAGRFAEFADAPVARTRQAAIEGTLSIMVGASPHLYARIAPLLYALELARSAGLELQAAGTARRMLERTVALGLGDAYHTAVLEAVRKTGSPK